MSTLTIIYNGVAITYDEGANRWRFVARGRERSSESLALAKMAIDKPDPAEKTAFTKQQAWSLSYSGDPEEVTLTAEAEGRFCGEASYWIKSGSGRSKQSVTNLFEKSAENDALIQQYNALKKEAEALSQKIYETRSRLTRFTAKT